MPPNQTQPTGTTDTSSSIPNPDPFAPASSGVAQSGHAFFKVEPVKVSPAVKNTGLIFVIGLVIGCILIGIGVIFRVSYQATDESGRNVAEIQQEIDALADPIAEAKQADIEAFQEYGFSGSYYNSANAYTELELEKADLESTLEVLTTANAEANIFSTGAIYFFLAGVLCFIISITVFLALRSRRPRSNSMVVG